MEEASESNKYDGKNTKIVCVDMILNLNGIQNKI